MVRKPVLKQFGDLTAADFAKSPVWASVYLLDYDELWYDDTNEETFRPWIGELPVGPEKGIFLVRAKLTLADGCVFDGFITPQHQAELPSLGTIQPNLFLPSGKLCSFWDGMFKRPSQEREIIYRELGKDAETIFPIQFAAEKGLARGHVAGSIPGFCWRPKGKVHVYH